MRRQLALFPSNLLYEEQLLRRTLALEARAEQPEIAALWKVLRGERGQRAAQEKRPMVAADYAVAEEPHRRTQGFDNQQVTTSTAMGDVLRSARWHVLTDRDAVAGETAYRVLRTAEAAIAERGIFRIALAGGRTPERAYRLLAEAEADWAHWEIYFGEERCLPPEASERNSVMASQIWLDPVPIPSDRIHPIPVELGAEQAARLYERLVANALPFDMVILGMDEDGHTASLFPGRAYPEDELVHAIHDAPKPPPERVTLSASALVNAKQILVLVTGSNKSPVIQAWYQGEPVPIGEIHALTPMTVLTDQEAGL